MFIITTFFPIKINKHPLNGMSILVDVAAIHFFFGKIMSSVFCSLVRKMANAGRSISSPTMQSVREAQGVRPC